MILSILICTTHDRKEMFDKLYAELTSQVSKLNHQHDVEVLFECDNKEISVGAKRQLLIERSSGDFVVFVDSDDWIPEYYVFNILFQITRSTEVDCVGFLIDCDMQGVKQSAIASNKYEDWGEDKDGYKYVRTIYHKTPVKRSHALQIGYKDMRYAEDYDFSSRLKKSGLLVKEAFINQVMYYYRYKFQNHKDKYGIVN